MQPRLTIAASIVLLSLAAGCGGDAAKQPAPPTTTVRGLLTGLEPTYSPGSPVPPQALAIRGQDGVEVYVRIGPAVDTDTWNMLHLNSHLLNGEPLAVTYKATPGGAEAVTLDE